MLTSLGVDLAAQPANTAACLVEWGRTGADVKWVRYGLECSDDALVEWTARASAVGIDAPFGWPETLVELLPGYLTAGRWPLAPTLDGGRLHYDRLRYRETDRAVHRLLLGEHGVSLWPLSVSSDSIAVVAWRCAHLLHRHAELTGRQVDRLGETSGTFETYPAAALAAWKLPRRLYKARVPARREAAERVRVEILGGIERAGRGWLREISPEVRATLITSDHALDAFISALVAHAAAQGHTTPPKPDQIDLARREGWIYVPRAEALESLGQMR